MIYQYRWIYAACCALLVVACGYWMDLQILLNERDRLASTIKAAAAQKPEKSAMDINQKTLAVNTSADFSAVAQLLQRYHLQLVDVTQLTDDAESFVDKTRKIKLIGEYQDLRQLIAVLAACDACEIDAVVLTPVSRYIQAEINVTLPLQVQFPNPTARSELVMNPFCGAENAAKNTNQRQPVIDAIHFLGTVVRNDKVTAIVKFPDGVMSEFVVGDVIGSEGGKVVEIAEDKLIILYPDHSRKELH